MAQHPKPGDLAIIILCQECECGKPGACLGAEAFCKNWVSEEDSFEEGIALGAMEIECPVLESIDPGWDWYAYPYELMKISPNTKQEKEGTKQPLEEIS